MPSGGEARSEQERYWDARAERAARIGDSALAGTVTDEPETVALRDRLEMAHLERLWRLSSSVRVLDLASGAGRIALQLAPRVAHVTLFDLSQVQLALAAQRAAELGIKNVSFVNRSLSDGEYGGPFDLIVLFGVCVYLSEADLPTVVEHCHRALAPGGKLLLKEPVSTTGRPIVQERADSGVSYRALFREREYYARVFSSHFSCRYQSATCAHLIPWFMGGTEQALPAAQTLLSTRFRALVESSYVKLDPLLLRMEGWLRRRPLLSRALASVPVVQDFYLFERER